MPRVKGRKQARMVVVPHRPWRNICWGLAVALLLLLSVLASHYYGYYRGTLGNGEMLVDRHKLELENVDYQRQVESLRQELVNTQQEHLVDQQTLADVQGTLIDLRDTITELEEELVLYRQIMSPQGSETGLVIGEFKLFAGVEPLHFRYRLSFMQLGDNERELTGHANINILGFEADGVNEGGANEESGETLSIPLSAVSVTEEAQEIALHFQYYQNVEGELVLPAGFSPDGVEVVAVADNDDVAREKIFDWLPQPAS